MGALIRGVLYQGQLTIWRAPGALKTKNTVFCIENHMSCSSTRSRSKFTSEPDGAGASVLVDAIRTNGSIETRRRCTFVDVDLNRKIKKNQSSQVKTGHSKNHSVTKESRSHFTIYCIRCVPGICRRCNRLRSRRRRCRCRRCTCRHSGMGRVGTRRC